MREEKRGQAAMEFLMTYGWAILAAIIVIAVIAIYFRPSTLVSNSVVVSAPFYGVGVTYSATQIQVEIRNNGGEDITAVTPTLSISQPSTGTCTAPVAVDMTAGETTVFTWTGCTGLSSGDTISGDINVGYTRSGSSLPLTSSGSIAGKVA
ncbi:MAG: hypothetical protein KKF48_00285 [Nanoarchaeota archaeon]|nr:hypothetical protein [Nanoarchaeota archaeon]MBU1027462.1 hypothetical protein [Nanoarchaeota archaeon]